MNLINEVNEVLHKMAPQEKVEGLITEAQSRGWMSEFDIDIKYSDDTGWTLTAKHRAEDLEHGEARVTRVLSINDVIFDKDFVRALFQGDLAYVGVAKKRITRGSLLTRQDIDGMYGIPHWQYCLEQAVVSDDPLDCVLKIYVNYQLLRLISRKYDPVLAKSAESDVDQVVFKNVVDYLYKTVFGEKEAV